jgi:hypothetical protein
MLRINLHDHVDGEDPSSTMLRRTCNKCKKGLKDLIRRSSKINTKQTDDGLFDGEDTSSVLLSSRDFDPQSQSDMRVQTSVGKSHSTDGNGEWSPLDILNYIPSISPVTTQRSIQKPKKQRSGLNSPSGDLLEIM